MIAVGAQMDGESRAADAGLLRWAASLGGDLMVNQQVPSPRSRGRDYVAAFGVVGAIMALSWGCSVLGGDDGERGAKGVRSSEVSADQVAPWPFTVSSGTLRCRNGILVTFEAGGVEYALNGSAKTAGYPSVEPVWAEDPQLPGLRVDIHPALLAGSALC